jgi:hypothetical protein
MGVGNAYSPSSSGFGPLTAVDHCYFSQDLTANLYDVGIWTCWLNPAVLSTKVSRSYFRRVGYYFSGSVLRELYLLNEGEITANLFDSCLLSSPGAKTEGNVFLKNYNTGWPASKVINASLPLNRATDLLVTVPTNSPADGGKTYFLVSGSAGMTTAEIFAQYLGGHLVSINDEAENQFVTAYANWLQGLSDAEFYQLHPDLASQRSAFGYSGWLNIGLVDQVGKGAFVWTSGEPVTFTKWNNGEPKVTLGSINYVGFSGGFWNSMTWGTPYPKLCEVPGIWTREQLNAAREAVFTNGAICQFKNNAILNVWQDPNPDHWMRFKANTGRDNYRFISSNFWATTSRKLIDAAIYDFNDDFNLEHYPYEPILTNAPEAAYPFVVDVKFSTGSGQTTIVGPEPVTFTVSFNRDIDTNLQPQVSFGPDTPLTDYTVHPVDGGWRDPRTWVGTFNITPMTGDGYQLIRVAGAVAADDPWLVTGDDGGRFRFEVITSGTESMNLQATGAEGKVDLSWMQDDFELLAGYNLYRSTNPTNGFARINTSIVPAQQKAFRDTQVQPGQPYYYKFTVVKSDMSESDFSNVAQGTPLDTIPPVITHTPLTSGSPGLPLTLFADVTDNVGVQSVTLCFRTIGSNAYTARAMIKNTGNRYAATIEGSRLVSPGVEYYIEATDGVTPKTSGRPELPNQILVVDKPVVTVISPVRGPASGGTTVTIAGANFKVGATVTMGGLSATAVAVLSGNQIQCVTPAHFPATSDVAVRNPDGQSGTLLRGFVFERKFL